MPMNMTADENSADGGTHAMCGQDTRVWCQRRMCTRLFVPNHSWFSHLSLLSSHMSHIRNIGSGSFPIPVMQDRPSGRSLMPPVSPLSPIHHSQPNYAPSRVSPAVLPHERFPLHLYDAFLIRLFVLCSHSVFIVVLTFTTVHCLHVIVWYTLRTKHNKTRTQRRPYTIAYH